MLDCVMTLNPFPEFDRDNYPVLPSALDCDSLLSYLVKEIGKTEEDIIQQIGIEFDASTVGLGDGGASAIINDYIKAGLNYSQICIL